MKRWATSVFTLLTLICCLSIATLAQSDRGTIVGTIKDPNGAVVSNAKVTVTNIENGEVREVRSSNDGNYTVPELKAAPYKISVTAPGFKTATLDEVRLGVQVTRRQDVTLEIGNVG